MWGNVPAVVEMQSEGGAAGALHGALQSGALATTFTASQGLLLMIPNMYKIAGELTPAVFHVAARSLAAQGLSIFGDHSDVMAVRQTGFALLASASVQEAHDLALVAQAATLETRVPFVHFFDGFRTSHELNTIELLSDDDLRALVPEELVRAHRGRALSPERPFIRGTAQNPDVYFQARETVNPFYARVPGVVEDAMARLAERTGRRMHVVDYHGASRGRAGARAHGLGRRDRARDGRRARRAGRAGRRRCRCGCTGRSRPRRCSPRCPPTRARDRRARPHEGARLDGRAALPRRGRRARRGHADGGSSMPPVIGGRYGLSSKEFTPGMVAGVLRRARTRAAAAPLHGRHQRRRLAARACPTTPALDIEPAETVRAVFFGLGSDGTVGANKNTIKILGAEDGPARPGLLRLRLEEVRLADRLAPALRAAADPRAVPRAAASFVGCHQFGLLERVDVLGRAAPGATLLLNCPHAAGRGLGRALAPGAGADHRQAASTLYVIDAGRDRARGRHGRPHQHRAADLLLRHLRRAAPRRGDRPDQERDREDLRPARAPRSWRGTTRPSTARSPACTRSTVPGARDRDARRRRRSCPADAPAFVRTVTAAMLAGRGDELPVSALPVDGTYPSGTAAYEKRNISELVPVWDPDLCIQCGNCSFVCPHCVIRSRFYDESRPRRRARRLPVRAARRASACPTRATRCRSTSRTAPAARSASRPARSTAPASRAARRSTSPSASRSSRPSARASPSSRRCP